MKLTDIRLRDPFVFHDQTQHRYLMTGTGRPTGFPLFASADLVEWEQLPDAFTAPPGFWADRNFWAPELHEWRGGFYLFGSLKTEKKFRATQIFVADQPAGPYRPLTDGPITPRGWECLDGTLHVENGAPWIVFCREWTQTHDGGMWALPLTPDLKAAAGRPVWLFDASEAPWVRPLDVTDSKDVSIRERVMPSYVTDGPWLHRLSTGTLLMLWSSFGEQGYALGIARSAGGIAGPWAQDAPPLFAQDGGHGMLFTGPDGGLRLSLHQPNQSPRERPHFFPVREQDETLILTRRNACPPAR
jgi:arabinan endo-1,5-alpha-L-arabinosidase